MALSAMRALICGTLCEIRRVVGYACRCGHAKVWIYCFWLCPAAFDDERVHDPAPLPSHAVFGHLQRRHRLFVVSVRDHLRGRGACRWTLRLCIPALCFPTLYAPLFMKQGAGLLRCAGQVRRLCVFRCCPSSLVCVDEQGEEQAPWHLGPWLRAGCVQYVGCVGLGVCMCGGACVVCVYRVFGCVECVGCVHACMCGVVADRRGCL